MRSIGIKLLLGLLVVGLVTGMSVYLPSAPEWSEVYRPAALNLLSGKSPYEVKGFSSAPWLLFVLLPVAVLPEAVGRAVMVVLGIAALAYTARKFGASRLGIVLLLLSPPAISCHVSGDIDWLILLGFVLPPRLGLFLMIAKPEIGLAVAFFWIVEAWRRKGWRGAADMLLPVGAGLALSFLFYGVWFLGDEAVLPDWRNTSLWQISIPVGLGLLVAAFQKRQIEYALAASPCLWLNVPLNSWIGALMAVVSNTPVLAAAVAGLWAAVFI